VDRVIIVVGVGVGGAVTAVPRHGRRACRVILRRSVWPPAGDGRGQVRRQAAVQASRRAAEWARMQRVQRVQRGCVRSSQTATGQSQTLRARRQADKQTSRQAAKCKPQPLAAQRPPPRSRPAADMAWAVKGPECLLISVPRPARSLLQGGLQDSRAPGFRWWLHGDASSGRRARSVTLLVLHAMLGQMLLLRCTRPPAWLATLPQLPSWSARVAVLSLSSPRRHRQL
jgi:hypothetical protein